jgi:hypothetical protein
MGPARDTSGGDVKRIPRSTLLVSLTAAIALGTGGIAWATGATDVTSTTKNAVNPNVLSSSSLKNANLFSEVQNLTAAGIATTPDKAAERDYIDYDNSITFQNKKLPKCVAGADLATTLSALAADNTQDAVDDCGSGSVVGSGVATVSVGNNTLPQFTVTAFNYANSVAGPACTAPGDGVGGPIGCEFEGGNMQLILFARMDELGQSVPVLGEIQSPAFGGPAVQGSDEGTRLAVTDAPDVAGDAGAITLFNALVGKNYKYKKGNKTIKASYIQAKCDDVNKTLNYGATFVYDDASVDTDLSRQYCAT